MKPIPPAECAGVAATEAHVTGTWASPFWKYPKAQVSLSSGLIGKFGGAVAALSRGNPATQDFSHGLLQNVGKPRQIGVRP